MKKSIPIIGKRKSEPFILGNGREREFPLTPVLVLAHLEPELELFEADDIGDDGDDDLWHHYLPNFKQL